uniref:(northern house mosquito) hypothetical protein n=1 Tax=Culex pipiens TaxID=7175 RepID=A0A8D8BKR1_CULPI
MFPLLQALQDQAGQHRDSVQTGRKGRDRNRSRSHPNGTVLADSHRQPGHQLSPPGSRSSQVRSLHAHRGPPERGRFRCAHVPGRNQRPAGNGDGRAGERVLPGVLRRGRGRVRRSRHGNRPQRGHLSARPARAHGGELREFDGEGGSSGAQLGH